MTTRPDTTGKLPLTELAEMKRRGDRIVMVTAYDAPGARFADGAGIDVVLVGDSAAMVVLGHDSTVPATMDEMLVLTRAVTRGARRPLVVADMPFGSFQVSDEDALRNAIRFVKEAGADAVKLEGAGSMLPRVRALVGAGIPVMGHIGLTPQSATMLGGFKAQGRTAEKARKLVEDARSLEAAGCFSLVLEAVPSPVATPHHRDAHHPDDRDRRRGGLRRAGARLPRPPRPLRGQGAAVREAICRAGGRDPRRTRALCRGRALRALSRGAARLCDAGGGTGRFSRRATGNGRSRPPAPLASPAARTPPQRGPRTDRAHTGPRSRAG